MKVVMLHPDLKRLGGIETYCEKLDKFYTFPVEHFVVGRRPEETGFIRAIFRLVKDYIALFMFFNKQHVDIVHVNPSLELKSFLREGLFVKLAHLRNKKTVTFFHGWDHSFADKLGGKWLWLFKFLYGKTDAFIVLSEAYYQVLKSWGCTQPIYTETTTVGDDCLEGFEINQAIEARLNSQKWRIFFIARIFKQKGIFETIEAFNILKNKFPKIELIVAGDGVDLESAKSLVQTKMIPDIRFTGDVRGTKKDKLFKESHILCFPTYHNEGLPSCVVEAMAFGLPVVTRPVGGLVDFFKNGEHGYATTSKESTDFAELVEKLMVDKNLYKQISLRNFLYAQSNFLSSQAVLRFEEIYSSILPKQG